MNAGFPSAYCEQGRREGYVRDDVAGWPVYFEQEVAWDTLKDRLRALLQHRLGAFAALSIRNGTNSGCGRTLGLL